MEQMRKDLQTLFDKFEAHEVNELRRFDSQDKTLAEMSHTLKNIQICLIGSLTSDPRDAIISRIIAIESFVAAHLAAEKARKAWMLGIATTVVISALISVIASIVSVVKSAFHIP